MNFKIVSQSTPTIQQGTVFKYRLKVHGLPLSWTTVIDQWTQDEKFVDYQERGPYSIWHHTHEFMDYGGGTLMRDTVRMIVPGGPLGELVVLPFVLRDVRSIFKHRESVINRSFPTSRKPFA